MPARAEATDRKAEEEKARSKVIHKSPIVSTRLPVRAADRQHELRPAARYGREELTLAQMDHHSEALSTNSTSGAPSLSFDRGTPKELVRPLAAHPANQRAALSVFITVMW